MSQHASPTDDSDAGEEDSAARGESSAKRKRTFHPFRAVRNIFRRANKRQGEEASSANKKSRSTSELSSIKDKQEVSPLLVVASFPSGGLSVSHESIFSSEAHQVGDQPQNTQSLNGFKDELMNRVRARRDSDSDDAGLPRSACTSPTTADVLSRLQEKPCHSHSTCSAGSLISMASSENEEDWFFGLGPSSRMSYQERQPLDLDGDGDPATAPLNHQAAHHKIAVRPKRRHGLPRHRKLQLADAVGSRSLPSTPEVLEDMTTTFKKEADLEHQRLLNQGPKEDLISLDRLEEVIDSHIPDVIGPASAQSLSQVEADQQWDALEVRPKLLPTQLLQVEILPEQMMHQKGVATLTPQNFTEPRIRRESVVETVLHRDDLVETELQRESIVETVLQRRDSSEQMLQRETFLAGVNPMVPIESQSLHQTKIFTENLTELDVQIESLDEPEIQKESLIKEEISAEPEVLTEYLVEPQVLTERFAQPKAETESLAKPKVQIEGSTKSETLGESTTEQLKVRTENLADVNVQTENSADVNVQTEILTKPEVVAEGQTELKVRTESSARLEGLYGLKIHKESLPELKVETKRPVEPKFQTENTKSEQEVLTENRTGAQESLAKLKLLKETSYEGDLRMEIGSDARIRKQDPNEKFIQSSNAEEEKSRSPVDTWIEEPLMADLCSSEREAISPDEIKRKTKGKGSGKSNAAELKLRHEIKQYSKRQKAISDSFEPLEGTPDNDMVSRLEGKSFKSTILVTSELTEVTFTDDPPQRPSRRKNEEEASLLEKRTNKGSAKQEESKEKLPGEKPKVTNCKLESWKGKSNLIETNFLRRQPDLESRGTPQSETYQPTMKSELSKIEERKLESQEMGEVVLRRRQANRSTDDRSAFLSGDFEGIMKKRRSMTEPENQRVSIEVVPLASHEKEPDPLTEDEKIPEVRRKLSLRGDAQAAAEQASVGPVHFRIRRGKSLSEKSSGSVAPESPNLQESRPKSLIPTKGGEAPAVPEFMKIQLRSSKEELEEPHFEVKIGPCLENKENLGENSPKETGSSTPNNESEERKEDLLARRKSFVQDKDAEPELFRVFARRSIKQRNPKNRAEEQKPTAQETTLETTTFKAKATKEGEVGAPDVNRTTTAVQLNRFRSTSEPKMAPSPKVILSPKMMPEPKATHCPKLMPEPKVMLEPKLTQEPKGTSQPKVAPEPRVAPQPKVTSHPKVTSQPKVTLHPKLTPQPKVTLEPKVMQEAKVVPEVKVMLEPKVMPEPKVNPQPKVIPQPRTILQPKVTPEPIVMPEPKGNPMPKVIPQPKMILQPKVTPEPIVMPEPKVTLQSKVTSEPKVTLQSKVPLEPKTATQPKMKQLAKVTPGLRKDTTKQTKVMGNLESTVSKEATRLADKGVHKSEPVTRKLSDAGDGETTPRWMQLAQQRREQREQKERALYGSSSNSFSIESGSNKPSRNSKVLDLVNNFQKLQTT